MTSSESVAHTPKMVDITSFSGAKEAWLCPHLSAALSGPGEHLFHEGTVMRLDGDEHSRRRRTMGSLLRRGGHAQFRDLWLYPTADSALKAVLESPDADGYARVDLLHWARLVSLRLAAALAGLDGGVTAEGAVDLMTLMQRVLDGRPKAFKVVMGMFDESASAAVDAKEARDEILARYFEPSLNRRRALLLSDDVDDIDLPNDLAMLMARGLDPAWADPAMAGREVLFMLVAAINTTAHSLVWTLRELFDWLPGHPEASNRLGDEAFVLHCAEEAIRLHPVSFGFPRVAREDVDLQDGTHIPADSLAVIRGGLAGMDTGVYGLDADKFNPNRTLRSGLRGYGYAFGAGPHLCYGMPIVMGTEGINGSLVYLLQKVLGAGVIPDPDYFLPSPAMDRGRYPGDAELLEYRVVFPPQRA